MYLVALDSYHNDYYFKMTYNTSIIYSSTYFVEDLNSLGVEQSQYTDRVYTLNGENLRDPVNTESCSVFNKIAESKQADSKVWEILGARFGDKFPTMFATNCKAGQFTKLERYFYIGGVWVHCKDQKSMKELITAAMTE